MARRNIKRDHLGRFAGTGTKIKTATKGSYVRGSAAKNLKIGEVAGHKTVRVGAEFRTPAGRGVRVTGSIGYHGKPDRRLNISPRLDKEARQLIVTVKPNRRNVGSNASARTTVASRQRSAGRRLRT